MSTELAKPQTYESLDRNIGVANLGGDLLRFNGKTGEFNCGPEKLAVPPGRRLKFAP